MVTPEKGGDLRLAGKKGNLSGFFANRDVMQRHVAEMHSGTANKDLLESLCTN
jgi:hypothetical protein